MSKRSLEDEKTHLLRKIRRLERKIDKLPESETEADIEEGQIDEKIKACPLDDELCKGSPEERKKSFEETEDILDEEVLDILDEEVLDILSSAHARKSTKKILHKQVADRWNEILDKGLETEEQENIAKENTAFENVAKMLAPKLNKEMSALMNDKAKKRDQLIESRQTQLSAALACIGQALQMCLGDINKQKPNIIKKINESGRLLCNALFQDSKSRRQLVLSIVDKDLKETLLETEPGEYLFGNNVKEIIKTVKDVQKDVQMGMVLNNQSDQKKKQFITRTETINRIDNNRTFNWGGPPRGAMQHKSRRGGRAAFHHQPTLNRNTEREASWRRDKIPR